MAEVIKDLVPEPGVEQVENGVFGAADVEVDARVGGVAAGRSVWAEPGGAGAVPIQ